MTNNNDYSNKSSHTKSEDQLLLNLEASILTGEYKAGFFLPSERKISEDLQISRPSVHNAILRLEEKGLVQIIPRQGAQVLNFRKHGNLNLIGSLLNCYGHDLDHNYRTGLLNLLKGHSDLIIADICAHDFDASLEHLKNTLKIASGASTHLEKIEAFFDVHIALAEAAVNPFYTMLFNSSSAAIKSIGSTLSERDTAYHSCIRLWSSMLHQLKSKRAEKAYALNQTLFELIFDLWQ